MTAQQVLQAELARRTTTHNRFPGPDHPHKQGRRRDRKRNPAADPDFNCIVALPDAEPITWSGTPPPERLRLLRVQPVHVDDDGVRPETTSKECVFVRCEVIDNIHRYEEAP